MNIQLFLSDQEVELSEIVQFPLNRTFASLSSPTDILVEYTKSVNIPMTKINNRILANAYRLDDIVIGSSQSNIGLYIDPTKRIPMKLIYNGDIVLDGYAKFISSTIDNKKGYYTINLFGKLGDIFKEMMNIVTSESLLGELHPRYLVDYWTFVKKDDNGNTPSSPPVVGRDLVKKSWENSDHNCWTYLKENTQWKFTDVFGLAPSHRGLYPNFESSKIQVGGAEIKEMKDYIAEIWPENITGIEDIIGDGFRDYEMNQYRSYMMKPYIYFNQLMRVYAEKCKEITGYDINLDSRWFNNNNPYWSKICYMFDYFDEINKKIKTNTTQVYSGDTSTSYSSQSNSGTASQMSMGTRIISNDYVKTSNGIRINPITIEFGCEMNYKPREVNTTSQGSYTQTTTITRRVVLLGDTTAEVSIKVINKSNNVITTHKFWTIGSNNEGDKPTYTQDAKFLELFNGSVSTTSDNTTFHNYTITTPYIDIQDEFSSGVRIEVEIKFRNDKGSYDGRQTDGQYGGTQRTEGTLGPALYSFDVYQSSTSNRPGSSTSSRYTTYRNVVPTTASSSFPTKLSEMSVIVYSGGITFSPETIYQKEDSLFNVILQYTKMFGLVWNVDYKSKVINLLTRDTLFKNHSIEDWSNKIDISKGYTITQSNIQNKYIEFNYEDVDGYIYKPYKTKYGVCIGGKRLNTGYEFNNESENIFEGVYPSSVSSRSFTAFKSLIEWDGKEIIKPTEENRVMIDCDNVDSSSAVAMNNWYMRLDNIDDTTYITDDSLCMLTTEQICYISEDYAKQTSTIATTVDKFPIFHTMAMDESTRYGLYFNKPNEDYTYDSSFAKQFNEVNGTRTYINDKDIYSIAWKNYIDELYNVQSKVVTAYINLTNEDYLNFTFNKFVTIDNQLFLVNKIIDFNPSVSQLTKVELIRISNPNNIRSESFDSLKVSPTSLWMDSMRNDTLHEHTIAISTKGTVYKSDITLDPNISKYATIYNPVKQNANLVTVRIDFNIWEVNETGNIYIKDSLGGEAIVSVRISTD